MNKYIIPIVAALALTSVAKASETKSAVTQNMQVSISVAFDKLSLMEVFADSAVPLKYFNKSFSVRDVSSNTPLKTLVKLLESYDIQDSTVSEELRTTIPAQGWHNFYQTKQCRKQAALLDEKFKDTEIKLKEDSLTSEVKIYLKEDEFNLGLETEGGSYNWVLR